MGNVIINVTLGYECVWSKLRENMTDNGLNKKEVCFSETKKNVLEPRAAP